MHKVDRRSIFFFNQKSSSSLESSYLMDRYIFNFQLYRIRKGKISFSSKNLFLTPFISSLFYLNIIMKLNIFLAYDPEIALLDTYPKSWKHVHTKICTWMFIAAWSNQEVFSSKCICKPWHIHINGILFSTGKTWTI